MRPVDKDSKLMSKINGEGNFRAFLHNGLPCVIKRMPSGHLCGYVGILPESKAAQMPECSHDDSYHEYDYDTNTYNEGPTLEALIEVHGGVTYNGNSLSGIDDSLFGKRQWVGFDCAHLYDLLPYGNDNALDKSTYKDMDYVESQVRKMADQLNDINNEGPKKKLHPTDQHDSDGYYTGTSFQEDK